MNKLALAAIACTLAIPHHANPAAAQPAPEATPTPQATQATERVRCRTIRETGSRIPERICRTEAQWSEIERQSREALERNRRGAGASGDGSR